MVDAYIGIVGIPESLMELEFDNFKEASDFCDFVRDHFKEERTKLFTMVEREEKKDV